ncbi:hypothetical protein RRG08_030606 [Elysia crispata]|uniref:Uncharacterized protein n=1 Tax=Elysia crispata TaxID=231223 RepID=A0AAE0Y520_9GAST|nr:hypothetical protein RRG08_030606 [Elysia crispata]
MFRFINLGERETLSVRSIGALIHNVKECDGEPANQMIANCCWDLVSNGIVRREVDVLAESVGEIVESANVVETGDVSARVVSEIVNSEHFVESGDVPARDDGENVVESIYVPTRAVRENVVESRNGPKRDVGENVVESGDVPARDFGEILGDGNVVKSGDVPARDVGENVVESGDVPGRDVGEILGDGNVVKSGDVPARDVGENVMESGDVPARDVGEIVDGENLVESRARDVHSSRGEASCAEFSESLTYHEASMPQSNADSKLSKKEEKKQSRQFGKAYVGRHFDKESKRDFDKFEESGIKSIKPSKDANVTNICALRYSRDGSLAFKLSFEEEWQAITMGRRDKLPKSEPPKLYNSRRKIIKSKFDHLQQLKVFFLQRFITFMTHFLTYNNV